MRCLAALFTKWFNIYGSNYFIKNMNILYWKQFFFVEGTFLSAQFSAVSQIIALCVSFFIKSTLLTIN